MSLEIRFEELVKSFKVVDGKLYRLFKMKGWVEVKLKVNTSKGYCDICWNNKMFKSHRILYSLYHHCDVDTTLVIDHISGDKIDNSKENLRLSDNRENQSNRTKHRNGRLVGCTFDKRVNKWKAQIKINKKRYNLGYYPTEQEANKAYNTALECLKWELTGPQIQNVIKELRKDGSL